MSLATVRDFVWKRPGAELVLCYRRAVRAAPAVSLPPPPLPGSGGASKDKASDMQVGEDPPAPAGERASAAAPKE